MESKDFNAVTEATWPPASITQHGPWRIRQGLGGGQRVSAATLEGPVETADIAQAEAAMAALGQPPLFMVRPDETALGGLLEARGYVRHDPVVVYAAPVAKLATPAPSAMAAFPTWPPLGIATQLWAEAGIGAARMAIMEHAPMPKTCLLGRINDRAAGVAFVACHGKTAMLHALEISPSQRRNGAARNMMRAAAVWAADQGADTLCLAVTEDNHAARALYAHLGMEQVAAYHYRIKQG
ncbi:GNAT family N-acetyltransferase [Pseudorhodobacter aquimaris]|uniref:GNAT family N-acetyltransferase n=1 Tax=Pseudorhodobacter aquimaris TaxID=687412 RepID=UPI00067A79C5|nr:GNAT family N-acetyltransferase [Pseudorhodobacter aquimaris]